MKSTALWALALFNVVLLGLLVGRGMKPNAAVAQSVRPGDYIIIPVDFPGSASGSVVILDNVSGQMTAVQTDEARHAMVALPRMNVAQLFARDAAPAGGRRR